MTRFPRLAVFVLLATFVQPSLPQDGPPPHVQRLVREVLQLLDSRDDEGLRRFLESAVDPAWPAAAGRDAVLARIGQVRETARGLTDDVGAEREPDGLSLLVSARGVEKRVRLVLSPDGIRDMTVHDPAARKASGSGREGAVRLHLRALEGAGRQDLESLVRTFEAQHFAQAFLADTTHDERRTLLARIRGAAATAEAVMQNELGQDIVLGLRGNERLDIIFRVQSEEPFAILALRTENAGAEGEQMQLTWEGAGQTFEQLARDGFSGVVHLERGGKTILHAAYGQSNPELGYDNRIDTVFGIGSTPVDFTVAAINLLTQRGALNPSARIGEFVDDVPKDKAAMTVEHLISGRSGLPDFHDLPEDWDADLAWIDRDTAVRRILAQSLLFAPGDGRAHSHSAYGLAAAIVEIVSGQDYFTFLRDNLFALAGMTRTGMNGDPGSLGLKDFAVGRGASSVGLPNIPPNWGPTSWLVLGSGGMYSTLDDMLRFYAFVGSDKLFEERFARRYRGEIVGVGGSDRGFYFFHASLGGDTQALMMLSGEGRSAEIRALSRALERLVMGSAEPLGG